MACKGCCVKVKILKAGTGHAIGSTVRVPVIDGVPVSRFWRQRFKDAPTDGCIKIIDKQQKVTADDTD